MGTDLSDGRADRVESGDIKLGFTVGDNSIRAAAQRDLERSPELSFCSAYQNVHSGSKDIVDVFVME
jgi:hypothetical protein